MKYIIMILIVIMMAAICGLRPGIKGLGVYYDVVSINEINSVISNINTILKEVL